MAKYRSIWLYCGFLGFVFTDAYPMLPTRSSHGNGPVSPCLRSSHDVNKETIFHINESFNRRNSRTMARVEPLSNHNDTSASGQSLSQSKSRESLLTTK